jgi:predicted porin
MKTNPALGRRAPGAKQSLTVLAALAFAGLASAQSSVTLFGVVDVAVSNYSNKSSSAAGSLTNKVTQLTNSSWRSSALGIRGTEDLGGGLAAGFHIEAALANDTGGAGGTNRMIGDPAGQTGFFNRKSTISLLGPFGEIRLGRDWVPTFWSDTNFSVFGSNGVGYSLIVAALNAASYGNLEYVRASNSVGYFLPKDLGGVYGQAMYAFNERAATRPEAPGTDTKSGTYYGARLGWTNGAVDVVGAYGSTVLKSASGPGGGTDKVNYWTLAGSYDFSVVKLFAEYALSAKSGMSYVRDDVLKGWLLGVTAPVGPGLFRAQYAAVKYDDGIANGPDPRAGKWSVGYIYNLSKRTALYATAARISNKNGAALSVSSGHAFLAGTPGTSTGYEFGLSHSF